MASQNSFLQRFHNIEESLLSPALLIDDNSLASFHDAWCSLQQDFSTALELDDVNEEIIEVARTTSTNVVVVFDNFINLQTQVAALTASLHEQLDEIFADLTLSQQVPKSSEVKPIKHKALLDWMRHNLHNPYPSRDIRDTLARSTGFSRQFVDHWFVDTRKRIGWNALRKTAFNNKRSEIVAAAARFYASDPSPTPHSQYAFHFSAIRNALEELREDPQSSASLPSVYFPHSQDISHAYPSPEPSPRSRAHERLPSPILSDQSINNKRKRSVSPATTNSGVHIVAEQSYKRPRCSPPPEVVNSSNYLPSPAASFSDLTTDSDVESRAPPLDTICTHLSRKRRLSDPIGRHSKRPRTLPDAPRAHAVSNPIPLSSGTFDFDDWFQTNFDIPAQATVEQPDPSISLDIQLFDYSSITPDTICAPANLDPIPLCLTSLPLQDVSHSGIDHYDTLIAQDWDSLVLPSFISQQPQVDPCFSDDQGNPDVWSDRLVSRSQDVQHISPSLSSLEPWNTYPHMPNCNISDALPPKPYPLPDIRVQKERRLKEMKEATRRLEAELAGL